MIVKNDAANDMPDTNGECPSTANQAGNAARTTNNANVENTTTFRINRACR